MDLNAKVHLEAVVGGDVAQILVLVLADHEGSPFTPTLDVLHNPGIGKQVEAVVDWAHRHGYEVGQWNASAPYRLQAVLTPKAD